MRSQAQLEVPHAAYIEVASLFCAQPLLFTVEYSTTQLYLAVALPVRWWLGIGSAMHSIESLSVDGAMLSVGDGDRTSLTQSLESLPMNKQFVQISSLKTQRLIVAEGASEDTTTGDFNFQSVSKMSCSSLPCKSE